MKEYNVCSTMAEARAMAKKWTQAQRQVDSFAETFEETRHALASLGVEWIDDSSGVELQKVLERYDQGLSAKTIYNISCHQAETMFAVLRDHFFEDEASFEYAMLSRNYQKSQRNLMIACCFIAQQKKLFSRCIHLLKEKAKQLDAQRTHEQFVQQIEMGKALKAKTEERLLGNVLSPTPRNQLKICLPDLTGSEVRKTVQKKGINKTVNPLSLPESLDEDIKSISMSRSNSEDIEDLCNFAELHCKVEDEDEDEEY